MVKLAIKRIIFSGKDNTFTACCPKSLEINHISAGNKFLKNQDITRDKTKDKTKEKNKENRISN